MKPLLFLLLVSLLLPPLFPGPDRYYVDGWRGDDGQDGRRAPWRTIQKAADTLAPGQTCVVLPGRYQERVRVRRSGRPGQPLRFLAEEGVVMRGFTIEADYVEVSGFEITATENHWREGAGIFVRGSQCVVAGNFIHDVTRVGIHLFAFEPDSPQTSRCIVRDNTIVRAGLAGIEILGRDHLVEGNDISRTLQYPPRWVPAPEWADADGLHFFGSGHVIRRNRIHDIRLDDPENVDPHIDAIQTFGPAEDVLVEENIFEILDSEMQIAMVEQLRAPVRNLVFRNNLFLNSFRGLNFWGRDEVLEGITVVHNVFFNIANYAIELHRCRGVRVFNNVFYDVGSHQRSYLALDRSEGVEVGHNAFFLSGPGSLPSGFRGESDLWQLDPLFQDVRHFNFRLRPDSPLIDAGKYFPEVRQDMEGVGRPRGSGFDIGAFEYAGMPR